MWSLQLFASACTVTPTSGSALKTKPFLVLSLSRSRSPFGFLHLSLSASTQQELNWLNSLNWTHQYFSTSISFSVSLAHLLLKLSSSTWTIPLPLFLTLSRCFFFCVGRMFSLLLSSCPDGVLLICARLSQTTNTHVGPLLAQSITDREKHDTETMQTDVYMKCTWRKQETNSISWARFSFAEWANRV